MATEQEQRDAELLSPYLNKYGVDPSQTSEAITAEREALGTFLGKGIPRGVTGLLGLPADVANILAKINPATRNLPSVQERDWLMDPETPLGGEWLAEHAGLPRTGDPAELLGELASAFVNPATAGKGIMGLSSKVPFIERQINRLIKAGKMPKTAKAATGMERMTLSEVIQEAEKTSSLRARELKEVGTPWAVGTKEELLDLQRVADDYIKDSRGKLYGGLDEVKDVLYNMERTVDELLAADMIPLKGYKAGTSKPQVLEKGKIYFFNRAHADGNLKNLQGFVDNPDLGMDIIIGGKDGMADAVLHIAMEEGIGNKFYVASLRSNTPLGGQKILKEISPTLDKLGIEVHMYPSYSPSWKVRGQSIMRKHYAELDKSRKGNFYIDKFKKQLDDYGAWLKKKYKREGIEKEGAIKHTTRTLRNWYKRIGKFEEKTSGGGMVRRPEYSRYEKWLEGQKKIPKKGMGGLIDSPLYLRDY